MRGFLRKNNGESKSHTWPTHSVDESKVMSQRHRLLVKSLPTALISAAFRGTGFKYPWLPSALTEKTYCAERSDAREAVAHTTGR